MCKLFGRLKVGNSKIKSKHLFYSITNCTIPRQFLYIRSMKKLVLKWHIKFIFCFILFHCFNVKSQSINALTFGTTGISQTGAGGTKLLNGDIIVAGNAEVLPGNSDFSISKLGATGQFKWTNYLGTTNNDLCSMMDYDGSGKVYLCGTSFSNQNYNSGLVICFDTAGNSLWQQSYSLPNSSISLKGIERTSNGLMLVGNYSDPSSIGNDIIMLMTDSLGTIQHYHIYGDPTINEVASGMTMVGDTLALIACDKFVGNSRYNAAVLACDSSGMQLWETTLTSRFNSGSKNLMLDKFNNVIVVGETETDSSLQFDIQISKLDLLGNLFWIRSITGSNFSDAGFAVCNSSTSNYAITGFFFDTVSSAKKIMLLETDTSGSLVQLQLYGNSAAGLGMSIEPNGNSYLIVGSDLSNGLYQVVFDSLSLNTSITETFETGEIKVYPNPFKNQLVIEIGHSAGSQITGIELFDLFGHQLFEQNFICREQICSISVPESLSQGVLLARINFTNGASITKRIVHLK